MGDIVFTADVGDLKKKVAYVRNGLSSNRADSQAQMIRLDVQGTKLVMFAAGKEMFARCELQVKRPENPVNGSFTMMGGRLEKVMAQAVSELIHFKADDAGVEIKTGNLTVNFELFDGAGLKTIEHGVAEHLTNDGLAVSKTILEEALICCKSCIASNSIKQEQNHVELRKGKMFSSDSRRFMIYDYKGFPQEMSLKVPASTLDKVVGGVKAIDAEKIAIIEADTYYFLKANRNEFTMGIRKTEREFPDMETLIRNQPVETDKVEMDKKALEVALRGVALALAEDDERVTIDLNGTGGDGYLEVSALNRNGRRSSERSSAGRKATVPVGFPISYKHLLDTLAVFKGDQACVDMLIIKERNFLMIIDKSVALEREVLTIIPFRTEAAIEAERKEAEAIAEARKKADAQEAEAGVDLLAAAASASDTPDNREELDLE